MLIEEPKQDNNNLEVSVLASEMNSQEVLSNLIKKLLKIFSFFFVNFENN